ncbi:MAG: glycosyltransferase [Deltaproteobacteria bacterium]|nr:glycosyltransferase [Deltaproteobacteria bacterium]
MTSSRDRPLHVLHLIKGLGRGGAEMLLADGPSTSDPAAFRYSFAYFVPYKDALVPELTRIGRVTCLPAEGGAAMLARLPALVRLLRQDRPDVIHCHMPLASVLGRVAGRIVGVPVLSTEHNLLERYHPATRAATLATFRLQRHVVAVSDEVAASIRRHAGPAVPVTVVKNGVSTRRFVRDPALRAAARERLGISGAAPVVGTVAVFRVQKRLDLWLAVASQLRKSFPDARFLLVGDGPLRAEVDAAVGRFGLGDAVLRPGLQEDVRPFLAAMDLFFVASDFEGLPVALLEAMASEVPAVVTDAGGMPEVVGAAAGRVVPRGDVPAMVAALVEVLGLPAAARAELGAAARARVESEFGTRRMMDALEALYRELAP